MTELPGGLGLSTRGIAAAIATQHEADNASYAPLTATHVVATASASTNVTNLQAALDATAGDPAKYVKIVGTFPTNTTVTVKGNFDGSAAVLNYSGAGIAITVGVSAPSLNFFVNLPTVNCTTKPGTGWAAGTTGAKLLNLDSCLVTVPHITGFETGLLCRGEGQGMAYNTITLGMLDNNKVNHSLDADATGWVNQNTFIGGRCHHESAEGVNVAGASHISINGAATSPPNNNHWLNTSMEGVTAEYSLDAGGVANMWLNCRWETASGAKVRWQNLATGNQIFYGYRAESIVETFVAGAGPNHRYSREQVRLAGTTGSANLLLENSSSSASPVDVIMAAGATAAGANPLTAYGAQRTAVSQKMKGFADAEARLAFTYADGRILFGNGVVAPTAFIGPLGTTGFIFGGALAFDTPSARDVGASANKARNVWCCAAISPLVTKTTNYTLSYTDGTAVFNGTSLTATLPDPTSAASELGREYLIKNINASALTVVSAGTSKTLDGAASQSLAQWAKAHYITDGTQWLTV